MEGEAARDAGGDRLGQLLLARQAVREPVHPPQFAAPRWDQVDARLTWTAQDGRTRVILFLKNLFDDIGYDSGAGAIRLAGFNIDPATGERSNVLQGVFSGYSITPPRTLGIELQRKFF